MSKIYFAHAATGAGAPIVKAPCATIDRALGDAEFELRSGAVERSWMERYIWAPEGFQIPPSAP